MTVHYLNYNGAPVEHDDTYARVTRKLVDGEWVRVYDTRTLFNDSVVISKADFDKMVTAQSRAPKEPSE